MAALSGFDEHYAESQNHYAMSKYAKGQSKTYSLLQYILLYTLGGGLRAARTD